MKRIIRDSLELLLIGLEICGVVSFENCADHRSSMTLLERMTLVVRTPGASMVPKTVPTLCKSKSVPAQVSESVLKSVQGRCASSGVSVSVAVRCGRACRVVRESRRFVFEQRGGTRVLYERLSRVRVLCERSRLDDIFPDTILPMTFWSEPFFEVVPAIGKNHGLLCDMGNAEREWLALWSTLGWAMATLPPKFRDRRPSLNPR